MSAEIFNIVKESAANKNSSPAGTTWSIGSINNINHAKFTFKQATKRCVYTCKWTSIFVNIICVP